MRTVVCAFDSRPAAERAVEALTARGIGRDRIHLEAGMSGTTAAGQGSSAGTGGEHGFMASIEHLFGKLFGADDANGRTYSEALRRGATALFVDARDETEADDIADVLQDLGAMDIDEQAAGWQSGDRDVGSSAGMTGSGTAAGTAAARGTAARTGDVMNVVQEELQVGKRTVGAGRVRVIQRLTEEPVQEIVRLRETHAQVERRPVDREATAEDLAKFREGVDGDSRRADELRDDEDDVPVRHEGNRDLNSGRRSPDTRR